MTGFYEENRKGNLIKIASILVFSIALMGVLYLGMNPQDPGKDHTEFYILGPDGTASDYPTNLQPGEQAEFIIGITNNEQKDLTYTIVLVTDEDILKIQSVTVAEGENWEEKLSVVVFKPETKSLHTIEDGGSWNGSSLVSESNEETLEILLFKGTLGASEIEKSRDKPYRKLELRVSIDR